MNPLIETAPRAAQLLLRYALKKEPRLTHFGIGVYQHTPDGRMALVCRGTEFDKQRNDLNDHLDEIAASADWIKRQHRTKAFNPATSYGYKHEVEDWFSKRGHHQYVANGSFIAAALGLGFDGRDAGWSSPNLCFQFSKKTVRALRSSSAMPADRLG